jgi:Ca-activated chloride channel homolog
MKRTFTHFSKKHSRLGKNLAICLIWALSMNTYSQDNQAGDKTQSPYFYVLSDNPQADQLPLKITQTKVNIVGVIADVTVHQVYKNEGKNPLEAIYTFPASSNAAIYAMEMTIGSRKITAKIEEKQKARREYNQAKTEGKRTSLLEQQRPNVFQMNVANIMPDDEIEVTFRYTELLVPENGIYEFTYPTVVGPRYSGGSPSNSPEDKFLSTPYLHSGDAPFNHFDINVHLSAGMPIQDISCSTHEIITTFPRPGEANVKLNGSEKNAGNRDFILQYQLSGNKIESGLMLYEHNDENFFLLMVQPPKKVIREEIPPREYIFIVDVSGSMRGFPIEVTKKLLRNLIINLRPTDMFNVMVFAGTSGWMSDISVPANTSNVEKAVKFIDNQNGGGSTELLPAMRKALEFPRQDESVSRSFVIVTDGYISVEKEVFDLISNNNDKANVFAFGIGSSVNRYLIEGMAHVGMGEPLVVTSENEANEQAEKFRKYISNPALTQVKKEFSGFEAYDVEPLTIPDVLAERPVIIYGKYKGKPKGSITIKGYTGKNRYKNTFHVSETHPDDKNAAIRYLWARKKVQILDDYNNLGYNDSRVKEVTNIGLKYNLMTAYTSFLAIDEEIVNDGNMKTVKQPLPFPQGVSNAAIGFEMEIDEENYSFFFHKGLDILTDIPVEQKEKLVPEIENNFITQINKCLSKYVGNIESITIEIDKTGKVNVIEIKTLKPDMKMEKEIKKSIKDTVCPNFTHNQGLRFKIIF